MTKIDSTKAVSWAREEFGGARLGNKLRTERLVKIAAQTCEKPAGKITEVFGDSAEREGAYRFLESRHVDAKDVGRAAWAACAERCRSEPWVVVPIDGTSEKLQDRTRSKGFGKLNNQADKARGVQTMTAIAVNPEGTSIGVAFQRYWIRPDKRAQVPNTKRPLAKKETRFWLETTQSVNAVFAEAKVETRRWYQLDAGADAREVLRHAAETDQCVTIRASKNRLVTGAEERHLWEAVSAVPACGRYALTIPPGRKRKARTATIEVRTRWVTMQPKHAHVSGREPFSLYAVLAREIDTTPAGEEPIEWMLLTNHVATTFEAACLVIKFYSYRWRIEDFHKTWKSLTKLEESQLYEPNFRTWATILASAAIHVERLKHLSRTTPAAPALKEFSAIEIEALLLLKQDRLKRLHDYTRHRPLTISQALLLIAELGGYAGRSSGGPPGSVTIFRGLEYLRPAAAMLALVRADAKT